METLTITKMNSKPYDGQYGKTNKVGILTEEYGDQWLNGFVNNVNFDVGDKIHADVVKKGDFMNFRLKGVSEPQNAEKTLKTQNMGDKQVNWDRVSFGKCKYGFMIGLLEKMEWNNVVSEDAILDRIEKEAEELARRAMRTLKQNELKDYGNGEEITNDAF